MSDDRYSEGFGAGVIDSKEWLDRAEAAEARCVELVAELDESERTITALKQWRDELQAQCARLEAALRLARAELSEFANIMSREDSFPAIDAALSDTAQETAVYSGEQVVEAHKEGATDMRERAAKLVDNLRKDMTSGPDEVYVGDYRWLARQIRALPIDAAREPSDG